MTVTTSTVSVAVGAPHGTRWHAEIVLENHTTMLCEWAEVAEEVSSRVYSAHQSFERYWFEPAASGLRSDSGVMHTTTRARAAYRAFLDRMLDKKTPDVLQVMEDYIESEADVVGPVVGPRALSGEHDAAHISDFTGAESYS